MKKSFISLVLAGVVLAGCFGTNSKTIDVDLTDEQIAALEAEVAKWDELINTPVVCEETEAEAEGETVEGSDESPASETSEIAENENSSSEDLLGDGNIEVETSEKKCDTRPDIDYFVEKARALESLGRIGEAIETYDTAFTFYDNSSVGWHNLGRLYEKIEDYKKAAENYQQLVDVFNIQQYNRDVAWALVHAGDAEGARKAYLVFVRDTGSDDEELSQAIKDLKK